MMKDLKVKKTPTAIEARTLGILGKLTMMPQTNVLNQHQTPKKQNLVIRLMVKMKCAEK